ncbi:MAG: AgmX/PglI C-terminal domain-containing protein [Hahellaceae bacterium]|nr:AgmX/PglI C-terminal domain-containing protein [Hahellaceae bacterium]MCP5212166.1 AgmX/PglI C-terminal domain-containing protein [Hahellaceae bacterium]
MSSLSPSRTYASGSMLPWSNDNKESGRLWMTLVCVFLLFLPLAVIVPFYDLPEIDRKTLETPPPSLAKVIIEKKIPPKVEEKKPEPKPEEKKEEPKPEEKKPEPKEEPKPEPKPEPKKEPKPEIKKAQTVDEARKVAQQSGLLALQDDLADMRAALDTSALNKTAKPAVAKTIAPTGGPAVDKSLLAKRSGGIDTSGLAVAAETVALADRQATVLQERAEDKALIASNTNSGKGGSRSAEDIRREFDKNKSSIYSIYHRALRKNPALQGKVLLELTIEPSGAVSDCKVISSDLNDKGVESKIISRVKLINFGKKEIETTTIRYSLDFVPS